MLSIYDQVKYISELDFFFIIVHLLAIISREDLAVCACMCEREMGLEKREKKELERERERGH